MTTVTVIVHFRTGKPMTHVGVLDIGPVYVLVKGFRGQASQYLRSEVDRLEVLP